MSRLGYFRNKRIKSLSYPRYFALYWFWFCDSRCYLGAIGEGGKLYMKQNAIVAAMDATMPAVRADHAERRLPSTQNSTNGEIMWSCMSTDRYHEWGRH